GDEGRAKVQEVRPHARTLRARHLPCLDVKKSEHPVAKEPSLVHDACVHQLALHGLHGVTPEGYDAPEHVAACLPGGHDRITCLASHDGIRTPRRLSARGRKARRLPVCPYILSSTCCGAGLEQRLLRNVRFVPKADITPRASPPGQSVVRDLCSVMNTGILRQSR